MNLNDQVIVFIRLREYFGKSVIVPQKFEVCEIVQSQREWQSHYSTTANANSFFELMGDKFDVNAMRYQSPSLDIALDHYKKQFYKKIIVFPLFPQYASASTGSVQEKVMSVVSKWEIVPEIEFINSFCDHPDFIQAFAELGKKHNPANYDHVLMSFHGLPERQIKKGDNYIWISLQISLRLLGSLCYYSVRS